jgi:pyruvate-formate lyase-activating enzyme
MTQCVLIRHGLRVVDGTFATCCYNNQNPFAATSDDIDPVHCRSCIDQELNGLQSYRQGANQRFGLTHDHASTIVLDITPNRNCNLACRICDEWSSSTWSRIKDISIPKNYNASVEEFSKLFDTVDLSCVEEINFSGGEPLLNNNLTRYLEPFSNRIAFDQITLRFSTNGTIRFEPKMLEFLSRFKLVLARFSIDDVGVAFEYQRWPAKWDQVENNWRHFLKNMPHQTIPALNRTVSLLNIARLSEMDAWAEQYSQTISGDAIELVDHFADGSYSLDHLTEPLKTMVLRRCGEHSKSWQYVARRPVTNSVESVKIAVQQHDQLHGTQLQTQDPELYHAIFA